MRIFYHKISKFSIIWSTYSYNRSLALSQVFPYELWPPLITFLALRANKICCFLAKEKNQPFYWLIFVSTCYISSNKNVIGTDGGTRTHMVSRQILSLVRLPVPPHRHINPPTKSLILYRWAIIGEANYS